MKKTIIQLVLVLLIIGAGLMIAGGLKKTAPVAEKVAIVRETPVVEVIKVERATHPLVIRSQAEIIPPKRTTLSAQVMGNVQYVSPKYEVGEVFDTGEIILKIEDIDYQTALVSA